MIFKDSQSNSSPFDETVPDATSNPPVNGDSWKTALAPWMVEEAGELFNAQSETDQLDAVMDCLAMCIQAMSTVDKARRIQAVDAYSTSQAERGRTVNNIHGVLKDIMVTDLDWSSEPFDNWLIDAEGRRAKAVGRAKNLIASLSTDNSVSEAPMERALEDTDYSFFDDSKEESSVATVDDVLNSETPDPEQEEYSDES